MRERHVVREYRYAHKTDAEWITQLVREGWRPVVDGQGYTDLSGTIHSNYIRFHLPMTADAGPLPGQHPRVVIDLSD